MEFIKTNDFVNIYKDMCKQFPPEELKTDFNSIFGENYTVYSVIEKVPVGYTILFETDDYLFIDYLAIYKDFHSKGFGGMILENLKQKSNKKGCFLEVEKPDTEKPDTLRRIKFYKKHGAQKLDINYIYPNNEGGLPMDLYYIPFNEPSPSKKIIYAFIQELFKYVHSDIKCLPEILEKIY